MTNHNDNTDSRFDKAFAESAADLPDDCDFLKRRIAALTIALEDEAGRRVKAQRRARRWKAMADIDTR